MTLYKIWQSYKIYCLVKRMHNFAQRYCSFFFNMHYLNIYATCNNEVNETSYKYIFCTFFNSSKVCAKFCTRF